MIILNFLFQGSKTDFSPEVENHSADCIRNTSQIGFGPTLTELREIVQDYVQLKQLKTRFVNDYPGCDWTISFLKRHQLSLKKGGQMQVARKNVTSDPFAVHDYQEMLKKEVE